MMEMMLISVSTGVYSIDLIQPDSVVVQPGESLTITCQVSGYSLTDNSYATGWIRQREGKPMDWILHRWGGGSVYQNNALKNKFLHYTLTSTSSVKLTGQNLVPDDTAVYYCVRHCDYFDYWGKGTDVTVTTASTVPPTVFPLIQCNPGSGDKITVGCLAYNFSPKNLNFQWTDVSGAALTSIQYPHTETNNKYTAASFIQVSKSDYDSRKSFKCSVNHDGSVKTLQVPTFITVTLKQPSAKAIFSNNQAELECVITGQDQTVVSDTDITWEIDGKNVTNSITSTLPGWPYSKTSKMTQNYEQWKTVNKVRCSAIRKDVTPVIQDLTVQKGDGSQPKVAVHVLPVEDVGQGDSAKVTLVCLISSPVQQDYYIAWSEHDGQKLPIYADGVNFPPQKTENGYSITSVYITNNKNWKANFIYDCNVMPAGTNHSKNSGGVSKAKSNLNFALSCTDDASEEDEFSSLWSTTSSFIFLFISSLFYNIIFSLVKVNMTAFSAFHPY
uniref:Ig-like domain-containing protein n=1 Tax=Seriola lalandi dorsalis TaxID=1841481 RepID=A0A3B4WX00_SERLL